MCKALFPRCPMSSASAPLANKAIAHSLLFSRTAMCSGVSLTKFLASKLAPRSASALIHWNTSQSTSTRSSVSLYWITRSSTRTCTDRIKTNFNKHNDWKEKRSKRFNFSWTSSNTKQDYLACLGPVKWRTTRFLILKINLTFSPSTQCLHAPS